MSNIRGHYVSAIIGLGSLAIMPAAVVSCAKYFPSSAQSENTIVVTPTVNAGKELSDIVEDSRRILATSTPFVINQYNMVQDKLRPLENANLDRRTTTYTPTQWAVAYELKRESALQRENAKDPEQIQTAVQQFRATVETAYQNLQREARSKNNSQ